MKNRLVYGRPDSSENREEKEMRVYDLLDSLNIEYQRVDHDPADNMEVCAKIDEVLDATICKNLFLTNRQQTDFYLLIMPGEKPFKTKLLSKQIGTARLSFGSPEQMEQHLDTLPGSASVLGLLHDSENTVQLLVDRELLQEEYFGCHPCQNTSSLRFRTEDLFSTVLPTLHHEPVFVDLPWNPD